MKTAQPLIAPPRNGTTAQWGWTWVGVATIPLWGTRPALATQSDPVPPLEFLAIAFAAVLLFFWPLERRKPPGKLRRAWLVSRAFALAEVAPAVFFAGRAARPTTRRREHGCVSVAGAAMPRC